MSDQAVMMEHGAVATSTPVHDGVRWRCDSALVKAQGEVTAEEFDDVIRRCVKKALCRPDLIHPDFLSEKALESYSYANAVRIAGGAFREGRLNKLDLGPVEDFTFVHGNLLTTLGATALWTKLSGGAGTVYDNSNAYIGVGDSNTAEAVGQTDLQASTNKLRKAMDATFPTISTNTITFRSTFGTSDANFAWAEWATFNASSSGTMLQRKVQSLGTKASGASWQFSVTLSLA